ncbi:hypothetical protein D9M71_521540 [compost metagenome]
MHRSAPPGSSQGTSNSRRLLPDDIGSGNADSPRHRWLKVSPMRPSGREFRGAKSLSPAMPSTNSTQASSGRLRRNQIASSRAVGRIALGGYGSTSTASPMSIDCWKSRLGPWSHSQFLSVCPARNTAIRSSSSRLHFCSVKIDSLGSTLSEGVLGRLFNADAPQWHHSPGYPDQSHGSARNCL